MSKFSCFSFGNPTNKTVTGTAYIHVGTTNSKPQRLLQGNFNMHKTKPKKKEKGITTLSFMITTTLWFS
jgi:hypothetical protein